MKKENRDQILSAYDEAARLLQFESFPVFLRYVCDEIQGQINQVRRARTRNGLEAWLSKEPDLDPEQLKATIKGIRLLPYTLRKALPGAAKEVVKRIPTIPVVIRRASRMKTTRRFAMRSWTSLGKERL